MDVKTVATASQSWRPWGQRDASLVWSPGTGLHALTSPSHAASEMPRSPPCRAQQQDQAAHSRFSPQRYGEGNTGQDGHEEENKTETGMRRWWEKNAGPNKRKELKVPQPGHLEGLGAPTGPSADGWVKKLRHIHTAEYTQDTKEQNGVLCTDVYRDRGDRFDRWVKEIPWRRVWQPTPVFLPGESH